MSKKFFAVVYFILTFWAIPQAQKVLTKSYALVIGVSKYEDPKITSLKHADKDAKAFADFCVSPSGLNISTDRLRILIDEKASYWNIIDGLDWLKKNAQRDDQIYIYFAGHGDMESKELKYGYLLAHDSRHMNYLGRSLSLDLLNKTAHTLSVNKKAKVFLLTDACHSGKLAGVDFNGNNLVALNLVQLVSNNEVRITSCNEGELSYEDEVWGNGRGAFSYFLTKGMAGEADGLNGKKDGMISIEEIKSFLSKNVPENVRNVKKAKQNPVVMGSVTNILNPYKINERNPETLSQTIQMESQIGDSGARNIDRLSADVFEEDVILTTISKASDQNLDFSLLTSRPVPEIIEVLLENLINEKKYTKKKLNSSQSQQTVAKALYDEVQQIIDLYLGGDEAELEKRRYYNQVNKPYEQYPYMLDIAIKLLPKDHYLIPSLKMQSAYLTGLNFRLKAPFKEDFKSQVDSALFSQNYALSIDSTAAYIHNELGILKNMIGKSNEAISHFEKAISIAPLWSLPYSNLANAYYTKENWVASEKYVDLALARQSTLQSPYITKGNLLIAEDNCLFAEEQYQHAIKINSRHFLPFDKLGNLYLKVQDFANAEKYYYEGAIRKLGLNQQILNLMDQDGIPDMMDQLLFAPPIDTTKLGDDVISCFVGGKLYFDKRDFTNAKRWFDKVVNLDVQNPLVYHYLGQIAFAENNYAEAVYYFKLTISFYLGDSMFNEYAVNLHEKVIIDPIVFSYYLMSHFDEYDPNIYLARTYEVWGFFSDAVSQYNQCIELKLHYKTAYQMLWNLYKSRMELESAESVIYKFGQKYPDELDHVLAEFYEWALSAFSDDLQKTEQFAYKYGLLLHTFVKKNPKNYTINFIRIIPEDDIKFNFNDSKEIDMFESNDQKPKTIVDVTWTVPKTISNPLQTGLEMFKKVESFTVDKNVRADAITKMGDLYLYSNDHIKALESFESSLLIKDDHHSVRSVAAKCADYLYLYQKSYAHLTTLEANNRLNYEDAVMLANYYMKHGEKDKAIRISENIIQFHPLLKDAMAMDIVKLYLRFEDYEKAEQLINTYLEDRETQDTIEYMLARVYAGLKKPEQAVKHLQNAESMGFKLGYVYKNDHLFDPYRTLNDDWMNIQEKMEGYLASKM